MTDSTSTLIAPAACDGVRENAGARGKYLPGTLGLHRAITMCITVTEIDTIRTNTDMERECITDTEIDTMGTDTDMEREGERVLSPDVRLSRSRAHARKTQPVLSFQAQHCGTTRE